MKVLAINGSARKDGNTTALIKHVFSPDFDTFFMKTLTY